MPLIPQGFNSLIQNKTLTQYTVPLVGIGAELFTSGNVDDAMELFQSAHQLLRDPSVSACECAIKNIQQGSYQLLRQVDRSKSQKKKLDLYQDDCNTGPQILDDPVRVDYVAGATEQDQILLESILLCNIALVYHSKANFVSARQLYSIVINSVHNISKTLPPCAASLEMGMRAHNNLGHILYLAGEVAAALAQFQLALLHAQQLASQSRHHRLEYAAILSNCCRCQWSMGELSLQLTTSLREVLRIRTVLLKPNDLEVASAHYNLAVAEYSRNDWQSAEVHFKQYLRIVKAGVNKKEADNIDLIPAITHLLLIQNEFKEDSVAQDLVRGLRTLQDKCYEAGSRCLEVASVMNFLGTLLFHQQDYDNALAFFHAELKIEELHYSNTNDITIAVTCNNIGRILQELGNWHEAIHYYQRALSSEYDCKNISSGLKDAHMNIPLDHKGDIDASSVNLYSTVWYNLGLIHDKLGNYQDAIRAFRMSLGLRKKMLGPEHPDIACLLYNIGVLQMEQQEINEAHKSFLEALRIRRLASAGQLNDQQIVKTLEKLSSLLKARGRIEKALDALYEILQIHELSTEHDEASRLKNVGVTLRSIAELHQAAGNLEEASTYGWKSVVSLRQLNDSTKYPRSQKLENIEHLSSSFLLIGSLYHENCQNEKAVQTYEEAYQILDEACASVTGKHNFHALRDVVRMLASAQCAPTA